MYLLYNLVLFISGLVLVPYYLLRGFRYGKSRRGIRERLGYYTDEQLQRLRENRVIWIHAVSVGETRAAMPLISALRERYPELLILVTNVTETGHAVALEHQQIDICLFFPFDFSWTVHKSLTLIRPQVVLIVETEIWPNFVRQARALNIPLLLVNGRLSDKSFPRYRLGRFFLRPILECFSCFCMQSQDDSERIVELGAPKERVFNTGNLKYDNELRVLNVAEASLKRAKYGIPDQAVLLVAGSTHEGEEQQLLEVYHKLVEAGTRDLFLIIIPRYPERRREIQALFKEYQFHGRLRSQFQNRHEPMQPGQVLLVDTLGEVVDFYSIADLVFVGGSLVPIGGHNLLEASLVGKPVLFGPHTQNFKEISAELIRAGAGIRVQDKNELFKQCQMLFSDLSRTRLMGRAGRTLIAENSGATERTVKYVNHYLS